MNSRNLKVGDRVRILGVPGVGVPGYYLHADTRRAYKTLVSRGRSLRINQIDRHGTPWFDFRIRRRDGKWEYHSMCITPDDTNWALVRHRKKRTGD